MDNAQRIIEIVEALPPYKDRQPKMKGSWHFPDLDRHVQFDAIYSDLINVWIPNQPDKNVLMELFILCGFDSLAFVELVITGELTRTAAARGMTNG